jgi:TonB family protein
VRFRRHLAISFALIASGVPVFAQRDLKIERIEAKHSFALIIGNNSYPVAPLKNAVNDARAMQQALQELGYETSVLVDGTARAMQTGIDTFASQLTPGDVALFYFAGHGVQIDGENYLIPVDFNGHDEADLKYQSVSASWVQEKLDRSNAQLKILIFDACRTNPFRRSRGSPGGLAQMQGGRGTFIAFATAAGRVANDNVSSNNGLFTQHLVNALKEPGQTLDDVFNHVRQEVDKASAGEQLPYTYSGVVGQYYFRPPAAEVPGNPPPISAQPIRLVNLVLAREVTPTYLAPALADPENEFLTTDPHVVAMFRYTGGHKGDKIRGEWRNPFGSTSRHFDIAQAGDGGNYYYCYYLPIAAGDAGRMPGNWELRLLWNDQGLAIAPFRISVPPGSPVQLMNSTVLSRATMNVPYRYQLRASGGVPPYGWTAIGALPPGLMLWPDGVLSGTPTRRGSLRLFIRARDSAGNAITRTLGLGVGMLPEGIHITGHAVAKALSSPNPCAPPAGASRFSPRDAAAWLVFSVEGNKPDDRGAVEWLGPFGEVESMTFLERKSDRQQCYQARMPISGARAAGILGSWTVRVLWMEGEVLRVPFEIGESSAATTSPAPDLTGDWVENGVNPCSIEQAGQELRITNKAAKLVSKGIVDGQTVRAQDWGVIAAISSDGKALTWSNGYRWVKQPAPVLSNASAAGNRSAPQQKRMKDQAEYDMFSQALKDAGNPQQALHDLDAWRVKYSDSDFEDDRNAMYIQAYAGANQPERAVDLAAQLMRRNLSRIFSDPKSGPQVIANALYTVVIAAQKIPHPTPEEQAAGETAARMLLETSTKPEGVTDADWLGIRTALQARLVPAATPAPAGVSSTTPPDGAAPEPPVKNVYQVGGDVTPPEILYRPEPEYTETARQARLQGSVGLSFVVSIDGRATDVKVVRGLGLGLDEQAVKALRRWKFKPGYKDGKPVEVSLTVEMTFRLL